MPVYIIRAQAFDYSLIYAIKFSRCVQICSPFFSDSFADCIYVLLLKCLFDRRDIPLILMLHMEATLK